MTSKNINIKLDREWVQSLVNAIQAVLVNIIPDSEQRSKYFTTPHIAIWVRAFTSDTTSNVNGQVMEYSGDRLLSGVMPDYFIDKFPGRPENQYTQLDNHFKSKEVQDHFMKNILKLNSFYHPAVNNLNDLKRSSDIFESFVGALGNIAKEIEPSINGVKVGHFMITRKLVEYLFKTWGLFDQPDFNVDIYASQPPKTYVIQFFKRIELPMKTKKSKDDQKVSNEGGLFTYTDSEGNYVAEIRIYRKQIDFINDHLSEKQDKITRRNDKTAYYIIGKSQVPRTTSAFVMKETADKAWIQARNFLIDKGFHEKWIEDYSQHLIVNNIKIKPYYNKAKALISIQPEYKDFKDLKLVSVKVEAPRAVFLLKVVFNNDVEKSIYVHEIPDRTEEVYGENSTNMGYIETLQGYIKANSDEYTKESENILKNEPLKKNESSDVSIPKKSTSINPNKKPSQTQSGFLDKLKGTSKGNPKSKSSDSDDENMFTQNPIGKKKPVQEESEDEKPTKGKKKRTVVQEESDEEPPTKGKSKKKEPVKEESDEEVVNSRSRTSKTSSASKSKKKEPVKEDSDEEPPTKGKKKRVVVQEDSDEEPPKTSKTSKKKPIQEDSDEEPPKTSKTSKSKKKEPVKEDSDEEPVKGKKKRVVVQDDSDEEPPKSSKSKSSKKSSSKSKSSKNDSEDDDIPTPGAGRNNRKKRSNRE